MISLLIVLALIGLLTWAIVTYIPMPAPFGKLIVIVAIVLCVLYVLSATGVLSMHDPGVPQLR